MSITTYSELKTAVGNWLARSDYADYVDDLITIGETWIYRNIRSREMETSMSVTVTNNQGAVPSGFIALKYAIWSTTPAVLLKPKPAAWVYQNYPTNSGSAIPQFIAVDGSNFIFGPQGSGTVTGSYYKNLGAVSSTAHDLFTNNPDLYLFAALAEAVLYLKNDSRALIWQSKRDQIKNDINKQAQESRFSDGLAISVI